MLDLERPVSRGEEIRVAMVGTINAVSALPREDDPYLSDEYATFNAQGTQAVNDLLHVKGFLPEDIGIKAASIGVSDCRRGCSDDYVGVTLTVEPELPELEQRRTDGLPTGTFLMLSLSGHNVTYSSLPPYNVGTTFAGDRCRDGYDPDLRNLVEGRLKPINEMLEGLKYRDERPFIEVFEAAKAQILVGNATPDRRNLPYKIPWMGLDPDDFPFGLP